MAGMHWRYALLALETGVKIPTLFPPVQWRGSRQPPNTPLAVQSPEHVALQCWSVLQCSARQELNAAGFPSNAK